MERVETTESMRLMYDHKSKVPSEPGDLQPSTNDLDARWLHERACMP